MATRRYLAYCGFTIVAGCVVGSLWFTAIMYFEAKDLSALGLYPLYFFDSFLVGWFPALLFGSLLQFVMFRFRWTTVWQWMLSGAGLAWILYWLGGWIAKAGLLSLLLLGLGLLRNLSHQTWPAVFCGAVTAAMLRPVAIKWANPTTHAMMVS